MYDASTVSSHVNLKSKFKSRYGSMADSDILKFQPNPFKRSKKSLDSSQASILDPLMQQVEKEI